MNPTSDDSSHSPAKPPGGGIRIVVTGIGHPVSFKTQKMAVLDSRTGKPRPMIDPRSKQWMDKCTRSLASRLLSAFQTTEGATSTDALRQFLTASLPHDDCWQVIPELTIRVERVIKGEEGFEIEIERL